MTLTKKYLLTSMILLAAYTALLPLFQQMAEQASAGVGTTISHADARHGGEAEIARQCSNDPNAHIFFNESTKRTAYVCFIGGSGVFGIHIMNERGEEVTAFLKNKMQHFEQVLKYMQNSGYQLLH